MTFTPKSAGTLTGQLSVPTNDPVHSTLSTTLTGVAYTSYPIPTITALLNPSYPIDGLTAPLALSVFGTNFFPSSVLYINGSPQKTTYINSTFLTLNFSPSLVNTVGEIPVTVVNPMPGGGSSAPYSMIGYRSISLMASSLTVDPVGGLLYAAIPASAAKNPSTIIPINPDTGVTMTPIAVAKDPQVLEISKDGSELYVASSGVLQRINLKTRAIEKTFALPIDPEWGQTFVHEMHVVPGSPKSIVVELFANVDPAEDGAALYNDSGLVNWIPGQSLVDGGNSIFWMDSFTFASSPSLIYALPEETDGSFFAEVGVSPNGISRTDNGSGGETNEQIGSTVRSDGQLLYTNAGQVWNPTTRKLLGTYLEADGSQLFYAASVLPDASGKHTYFLDNSSQYAQYQSLNVNVYDQANFALLGVIPFVNIYPPDATDLVRWGTKGFAFRCVDTTGAEPSANQVVIFTSNLVASGAAAPAPALTSISPAKVSAKGEAYAMQLTGSGFTNTSTVLINGGFRKTTYVSVTSLTAEVLASDIATAGQLDVQVTTPSPGGGASASVLLTVVPAVVPLAITVSPSSLVYAATSPGATSAPKIITIKNTGNALVTFTSLKPGGADYPYFFTSATTCGVNLAAGAACTVSLEFKPQAVRSYAATFNVTDNAGGSPQKINLSGTAAALLTIAVSPSSLTYPATISGATSAAQTITVKNTGSATVTLASLKPGGTDYPYFVKSATTCATSLAAGSFCTVALNFKPDAMRSYSATFNVTDNATDSPQEVKLAGTGVVPLTISVTPSSLSFPATAPRETSAAQTITIRNTGRAAVTFTSLKPGGADYPSFVSSATTCENSLAAGTSCSVALEFKPVAVRSYSATFNVTDNATGSPQLVTLSGSAK